MTKHGTKADGLNRRHEYDESCVCEDCVIERGRRLAVLMFGWMIRA